MDWGGGRSPIIKNNAMTPGVTMGHTSPPSQYKQEESIGKKPPGNQNSENKNENQNLGAIPKKKINSDNKPVVKNEKQNLGAVPKKN